MKALDIIEAFTRKVDIGGPRIVETPDNPAEIPNWLGETFGSDGSLFKVDKITCSNELKPNTKYIYIYKERISAKAVEDCKVMVVLSTTNREGTWISTDEFYLYEIE